MDNIVEDYHEMDLKVIFGSSPTMGARPLLLIDATTLTVSAREEWRKSVVGLPERSEASSHIK